MTGSQRISPRREFWRPLLVCLKTSGTLPCRHDTYTLRVCCKFNCHSLQKLRKTQINWVVQRRATLPVTNSSRPMESILLSSIASRFEVNNNSEGELGSQPGSSLTLVAVARSPILDPHSQMLDHEGGDQMGAPLRWGLSGEARSTPFGY